LPAPLHHRQPQGAALRQRGPQLQRHDEALLRLRSGELRAAQPAGLPRRRPELPRQVHADDPDAREAVDRDFRRGESAYDHFSGDPEHRPNPNLGEIRKPPFYAIEVFAGSIGTKGGPRVDADAQVLWWT